MRHYWWRYVTAAVATLEDSWIRNKLQCENAKYPRVFSIKNKLCGCGQGRRMWDVRSQIWRVAYRTSSIEDYIGHVLAGTGITRGHIPSNNLQLRLNKLSRKGDVRRFDPDSGMQIAIAAHAVCGNVCIQFMENNSWNSWA
jgi:hypothetical protein